MDQTDDSGLGGLGLDTPPQPKKGEAYRVLARKYRPSDFTGLVGQDALVRTLKNAFETGRIAHAFMLTGVRGVGKTTTARIIARALNCIGKDGKRREPTIQPCGVCEPCVAIAESRCVDVLEMDGASNNGVDEVRQITDSVRYAPASTRYKVYIIDEVHMLTKPAFNALLKTLEEPPSHVKFIFATTEIRKVPVTVLSRCQRFDLRRIESEELVGLLEGIAAKEGVAIERPALALIARAAEGSARDGLSLLDQAIAHGEEGPITAEALRAMLGLADRGRVLDLFEKLMGGRIAEALAELRELYDRGADPLVVMQDFLETTHFLTRVKVAPGAEGFFDGGSTEAKRCGELAGKMSVPSLTRAWQLLLKGLIEVRDATQPLAACEMALIRLAYAAELPPTDKLVRDVLDGAPSRAPAEGGKAPSRGPAMVAQDPSAKMPSPSPKTPSAFSTLPQGESSGRATMSAAPAIAPDAAVEPTVRINSLEELAALAQRSGAPVLRVQIENNIRLVRLEPGHLEFAPTPAAPRTLAGDLAQKLKEWTGVRWSVIVAREGGEPTLAEQRRSARAAKLESVLQEPFVRAVLDRFPGAEVIAVRDIIEEEIAPAIPDENGE